MSGVLELDELLRTMAPQMQPDEFVFCTLPGGNIDDVIALEPLMSFAEAEGMTLILAAHRAEQAGLRFEGRYRQLTLTVHSSLEAVGLTAAVSAKLTEHGISANVVAAFYHDHVFVPSDKAEQALAALREFSDG